MQRHSHQSFINIGEVGLEAFLPKGVDGEADGGDGGGYGRRRW